MAMHPQKQPLRAAIYCRISQQDVRVDKVQNQEKDCRDFADRCGYVVVEDALYADDGISAYKQRDRPGYDEMLSDAEMGKFDVIVATAEDRFSRNPKASLLLAAACAEGGVMWHTLKDGWVDPSSDEGEFQVYFRGWSARKEGRDKGFRISNTNNRLRNGGLPIVGVRPFGFEVNRIDHREDEAELIREAYAHILSGGKLYGLVKSWNDRGIQTSLAKDRAAMRLAGKLVPFDVRNEKLIADGMEPQTEPSGWSYQSLGQLLKRPRNAAIVEQGRDPQTRKPVLTDIKARWEPIVSREDWELVCAILNDPARKIVASREPRWLCAGLARCGACGEVMRSGLGSDRKGSFSVYRCGSRVIPSEDNKKMRHATVKTADLDGLVVQHIAKAFLYGAPMAMPSRRAEFEELAALQARLREVRQGLLDNSALVGTPGFKVATARRRGAELSAEEEELEEQIEYHATRSAHAAMLVESRTALFLGAKVRGKSGKRVSPAKAVQVLEELAARFESLPLAQQRTLVRSMLEITVNPWKSGPSKDRCVIERIDDPSPDDDGELE